MNIQSKREPDAIEVAVIEKDMKRRVAATCKHRYLYLRTQINGLLPAVDIFYCSRCLEYKQGPKLTVLE